MEEKIVKPTIGNPPPAPANDAPVVETTPKVEQIVEVEKPVDETRVDVDSLIPKEDYRTSPLFYEVVNFLGIPQEEWIGSKEQVSLIVEYAIRDIKSNDPNEVIKAIRKYEDLIQKPEWGVSRTQNLYRYIRLGAQKQSLEQAMKAFERGEK